MASAIQTGHITVEEFCVLIHEDQKADLIDGVIYMASPETFEGHELFGWIYRLMGDFVEARELGGAVVGSRVTFRLDDRSAPEPDIAYLRRRPVRPRRTGYVEGTPDLAMEIVSPDSIARDYELKRSRYERAGIREYWIIDDLEHKIVLLRLSRNRKYREVRPKRGAYHSQTLPGFWLRPEWLWQEPRPKVADILKALLTDRPE